MDEEKVMKQFEVLMAKILRAVQDFEGNTSNEILSIEANKKMHKVTPEYAGDPVADFRIQIAGDFPNSSMLFECVVDEGIFSALDTEDRILQGGGLKPES